MKNIPLFVLLTFLLLLLTNRGSAQGFRYSEEKETVFHEGLLWIKKEGKYGLYGFIDKQGKAIISFIYDKIEAKHHSL